MPNSAPLNQIYLDYNATTPCDPRVVEAMLPFFTTAFGNAASHSHAYGWHAREAVQIAREKVAAAIAATERELIFTSGATESVNLAIKGVWENYSRKGNHIITTAVEHHAVLDTCAWIEKRGGEVTYLPVNDRGRIDPEAVRAAIRPTTILLAVMHANNETGTLMPINDLGKIAKEKGVIFFCDASQSVGKVPVNVEEDGIDLLACSAHKFYGPKGVGALFIRRRDPRVSLAAQLHGGGHERGIRSGTLNVPGIVGMGRAAELSTELMAEESVQLKNLLSPIEQSLLALPGVYLNTDPDFRLPHTGNYSFDGISGDALMRSLAKTLAVSSGSACTSAVPEPSYVLKALGRNDELASAAIRIALGRFTTAEEVESAAAIIVEQVKKLRDQSFSI